MTSDLTGTLRWAHQTNIVRYQKLLKTYLADHERRDIERRLADEVEAPPAARQAIRFYGSRLDGSNERLMSEFSDPRVQSRNVPGGDSTDLASVYSKHDTDQDLDPCQCPQKLRGSRFAKS